VRLCEGGLPMAGVPLAARAFCAVARPGLRAVALEEAANAGSSSGSSGSGSSGTGDASGSPVSAAVAAALRKTRGAQWEPEASEPSLVGDDEALLPCAQVGLQRGVEMGVQGAS
jgi:hypothetical protein